MAASLRSSAGSTHFSPMPLPVRIDSLGACPSNRCSNPSESDSSLDYEQALSPLEYRSDAASAAECVGLRAQATTSRGLSLGWCGRAWISRRSCAAMWSGLGQPPFDPRMMVSLLLHGYASGLYSSRRIARSLLRAERFRDDCRARSAGWTSERSATSGKRHLKALGELFLQVLKLCETAGAGSTSASRRIGWHEDQSECVET